MTSGALRLSVAEVSGIGTRSSNQDAIGQAQHQHLACFVVSDGTGGHRGGEVAARLVVDTLLEQFRSTPECGEPALLAYLDAAAVRVQQARGEQEALHDMSATVAALVVDCAGARAAWAHLGDTRLYHFRQGRIRAVTVDHSLAQQLVEAGLVPASQLRTHPQRSMLLAAVGAQGDVAASSGAAQLEDGDALFICTDGLWEWVDEEAMERALASAADTKAWLAAMCAQADACATEAGKMRDNFSGYAIGVHRQD